MTDAQPAPTQPQAPQTPPAQPPQAPVQNPAQPANKTAKSAEGSAPANRTKSSPAKAVSAPPVRKDATFHASVRDAYALLDFATRRGMTIPAHITAAIVRIHDKVLANEKFALSDQTAFWEAFRDIIDLVQPVTVESILFSAPKTEISVPQTWREWLFQPVSPADRVLKRYLFLSLISLFLLLGLQIEWAIGISTYNDAYKVHTYLNNTTDMLEDAKLKADTPPTTVQDGSSSSAVTLQKENENTIQKLERRHKMDQSWDDVSYVRLWWWNRQFAQLIPPYDLSLSNNGPRFNAGEVSLDQEGKRRIEFTRAELTLEIISNYVLVTLFALLGAMTQALRTLAEEIHTVSLTQTRLYSIRTRIILGVISGVCMAWLLINSDTTSGGDGATLSTTPLNAISFLGAFTPWAMAFISGYSVEIFFTALERAIRTITKYIGNTQDQPSISPKKKEPDQATSASASHNLPINQTVSSPTAPPIPPEEPPATQTTLPQASPAEHPGALKPTS